MHKWLEREIYRERVKEREREIERDYRERDEKEKT